MCWLCAKACGHCAKEVEENIVIDGKNKLTDSLIDKLQNYYGIAKRSNSGDWSGMKSAIYANCFHCIS